VEHELLSLSKHMSSAPVFSGARVTRSCLCSVFFFVLLPLAIMLSVIPVQITPLVSSNSSSLEATNK
jgi:hypothetical protein